MKKTPYVFQKYQPFLHRRDERIEDAPDSKYKNGHVYLIDESQAEGCVWWRRADGHDLRHKVIHR